MTYSVQFQNGGFSLSDLLYFTVSLNFQKIVPVSYGKYLVSQSGRSCVLNECVFLCVTTRKPQNLDPANLYNIVEYTL